MPTVRSSKASLPIASRATSLRLSYIPPYDWKSLLATLRAHQLPELEAVDDSGYERVIRTPRGMGWLRVTHLAEKHALHLKVWNTENKYTAAVAKTVRRLFDLDADPTAIQQVMDRDPYLSRAWSLHPGLRIARSWSGFESIVTTILGQLVSVSFGRTLTRELMQAAGTKARHPATASAIHLFPTPKQLLEADLRLVRTSESRRAAIRSVAMLVTDGKLKWTKPIPHDELRRILLSVPGIGAWTSEYVAMRGFHDDDAFPSTDYGLKQELKRLPEVNVNRVRPLRAYAAMALWKSFLELRGMSHEPVL